MACDVAARGSLAKDQTRCKEEVEERLNSLIELPARQKRKASSSSFNLLAQHQASSNAKPPTTTTSCSAGVSLESDCP